MSRVATCLICLVLVIFTGTAGAEGLLNGPESVVYDTVQNRYLVSNWVDGSIVEIDSNGVQSYYITGRPNCGGSHIHGNILYSGSGNDIVWINLSTASILRYLPIPEATLLNAITSDNIGNVYVTDALPGVVYKIEGDEGPMYSEFVNSGLDVPVGITYDEDNDRLLVTGNSKIYEVTLPDGVVSVVANTGLGYMDAITQDPDGNFYVSCSYTNTVYKFDPTFGDPPELFSSEHHWPSQLCYNPEGFVLAVPNFNSSTIDFIEDPYKHDGDGDGHFNALDNCPVQFNPGQEDIDVDGVGDICDNCPETFNPGQGDVDGDGIGDSCEVIRTWYVGPEGTGDAATIQAAIDSCTHWDTVIVADGIYAEEGAWNVNLERKQIILKSENGPATTIIDCQGSPANPRRGVTVCDVPEGFCTIDGFTIRNGYGPNFNGGSSGGAILCDNSSPVIRNCVLTNNSAFIGGALTSDHSAPQLVNCTLFGNSADYGAAIAAYDYSEVTMENCIMAFQEFSDLVSCFGYSTVSLFCCDIFGNAGGDWTGCITGQDQTNGNFSADPEFCHVIAEDFGLLETSPCAPANNNCGALIGALGVGCSCDCGAWGDVNQDGSINPLDAVYMVEYVYLSHDLRVPPPNCFYGAGDVNCDGNVNPVDMVHFVNYVYLSITPFPCPDPCAL